MGGKAAAAAAGAAGGEDEEEVAFDSNHITPGTDFMAKVSEQLRYFIRYKLQHDQLWRGLRIILSDGSVPRLYLLWPCLL